MRPPSRSRYARSPINDANPRSNEFLAAGSPTSQQVNCTTKAWIGSPQSAYLFSGGSLTFDATQYNFTWKTAKNWGGTCRVFTLKLTDGTSHIAYVSFT